tara:strand:+ start:452 stop:709 length:258 start_codon:yes stop_codon:yes gene_type:complete
MPRVNIMLPEDILLQIDQMAREEGMNRSQLIRTAALVYYEQHTAKKAQNQRQADIQRAMDIQDHLRHKTPSWSSTQELRTQREEI